MHPYTIRWLKGENPQLAGTPVVEEQPQEVSHTEVLNVGQKKADDVRQLVEAIVSARSAIYT